MPSGIHIFLVSLKGFLLTLQVYDSSSPEECEIHQTKVFVCLEKKQPEPGLYWTGVGVAHLLLFLTLLAFFLIRDLRSLQVS